MLLSLLPCPKYENSNTCFEGWLWEQRNPMAFDCLLFPPWSHNLSNTWALFVHSSPQISLLCTQSWHPSHLILTWRSNGSLGSHMQKNKRNLCFSLIQQSIQISQRPETLYDDSEVVQDTGVDNDSWTRLQGTKNKAKVDRWDYIKLQATRQKKKKKNEQNR